MKVLITYVSESGNTEKMAQAVAEGVLTVKNVEVSVLAAEDLTPADVVSADALILGAPARYGLAYWPVYKLFDDLVKNVNVSGKIGAVFATGGYFGGGVEMAMLSLIAGMISKGMVVYSGGTGNGKLHIGASSEKSPTGRGREEGLSLGKNVATLVNSMGGQLQLNQEG